MSTGKMDELKAYFRNNNITQEQIAEKMGVSQAYVGMLLNGKKPFGKKQAIRFGELFGISPSWLLTFEGNMLSSSADTGHVSGEPVGYPDDIIVRLLDELKALREQNQRLLRLLEIKIGMENGGKAEGNNKVQD